MPAMPSEQPLKLTESTQKRLDAMPCTEDVKTALKSRITVTSLRDAGVKDKVLPSNFSGISKVAFVPGQSLNQQLAQTLHSLDYAQLSNEQRYFIVTLEMILKENGINASLMHEGDTIRFDFINGGFQVLRVDEAIGKAGVLQRKDALAASTKSAAERQKLIESLKKSEVLFEAMKAFGDDASMPGRLKFLATHEGFVAKVNSYLPEGSSERLTTDGKFNYKGTPEQNKAFLKAYLDWKSGEFELPVKAAVTPARTAAAAPTVTPASTPAPTTETTPASGSAPKSAGEKVVEKEEAKVAPTGGNDDLAPSAKKSPGSDETSFRDDEDVFKFDSEAPTPKTETTKPGAEEPNEAPKTDAAATSAPETTPAAPTTAPAPATTPTAAETLDPVETMSYLDRDWVLNVWRPLQARVDSLNANDPKYDIVIEDNPSKKGTPFNISHEVKISIFEEGAPHKVTRAPKFNEKWPENQFFAKEVARPVNSLVITLSAPKKEMRSWNDGSASEAFSSYNFLRSTFSPSSPKGNSNTNKSDVELAPGIRVQKDQSAVDLLTDAATKLLEAQNQEVGDNELPSESEELAAISEERFAELEAVVKDYPEIKPDEITPLLKWEAWRVMKKLYGVNYLRTFEQWRAMREPDFPSKKGTPEYERRMSLIYKYLLHKQAAPVAPIDPPLSPELRAALESDGADLPEVSGVEIPAEAEVVIAEPDSRRSTAEVPLSGSPAPESTPPVEPEAKDLSERGAAEKAEHIQLSQEMKNYAASNKWDGVEENYKRLEVLGKKGERMTHKDHLLGAEAARATGNMAEYRKRLVSAQGVTEVPGQFDAIKVTLEGIDAHFVSAKLTVKGKDSHSISIDPPPFGPDERAAFALAKTALEAGEDFEGLLPEGTYTIDEEQSFTLSVNTGAQVIDIERIKKDPKAPHTRVDEDGGVTTTVRTETGSSSTEYSLINPDDLVLTAATGLYTFTDQVGQTFRGNLDNGTPNGDGTLTLRDERGKKETVTLSFNAGKASWPSAEHPNRTIEWNLVESKFEVKNNDPVAATTETAREQVDAFASYKVLEITLNEKTSHKYDISGGLDLPGVRLNAKFIYDSDGKPNFLLYAPNYGLKKEAVARILKTNWMPEALPAEEYDRIEAAALELEVSIVALNTLRQMEIQLDKSYPGDSKHEVYADERAFLETRIAALREKLSPYLKSSKDRP